MSNGPSLLFSTFEPSGDALAAETISVLARLEPKLRIYALGGPRMAAAGAELLERTTEHGSMGLETIRQIWRHRRRLRRLRPWLARHPIDAFIPVDSPAGNWSICNLVRRTQPEARIVHLVAPQVWAWAPWRVRRLRRLTDHVLCLLPFEPKWFEARRVPATFVGHPIFDGSSHPRPASLDSLPSGRPRLALLPGSRRGEVERNWPTMLETFLRLRRSRPDLVGAIAALDDRTEQLLRRITAQKRGRRDWPERLTVVSGDSGAVLDWCDLALVVSGTATLEATARAKPMVILYNVSRVTVWTMGWMLKTRTFTLPNLVSEWAGGGRAVTELVPHFGQVEPVQQELEKLLSGDGSAGRQRAALAQISDRFADQQFTDEVPRQVLAAIKAKGLTPQGA